MKKSYKAKSGLSLPYQVITPSIKKNHQYPLVVVLHGAGERGNDNEAQMTHGSQLFTDPNNQKDFPAYVIFPQCREDSYWSSVDVDRSKMPITLTFDYVNKEITSDLKAVRELIDQMINEFPIDQNRIYITGLSMGGMGTFEMVHRYPNLFAAAMPICGGGDTTRYTSDAKNTPFWIFHGEDDVVVKVDESRKMKSALEERGYKVKYTEYPGVNHNSWDNAFAEAEFLSWMFSKKK